MFANVEKVYAANGDPCCAACVSPVFEEDWSMLVVQQGHNIKHIEGGHPPTEPKIKKSKTFSVCWREV